MNIVLLLLFAGINFQHVTVDANPPSGTECCLDICAVGDIDGDGLDDIMVGSENSIGIVWYKAPTWQRYVIGPGSFTTDGELADIDGDNDLDVVLSCISHDRIEWWENLGNDPVQWLVHSIGANFAHDVAVGDIDGDGAMDVVTYRSGSLVWFEAPEWTRRTISSASGEGLDVADIDGDGDMDIAASNDWYENTGTGWTAHALAWGSKCRDIVADMDGDGDKDIVLTYSEDSGRVSWFENPGWSEHVIEPDVLTGAHSLEVADFDGDGDMDVFTGEMHTTLQPRVLLYENTGAGWAKITLAITGTHNARLGDVNGDGLMDIVGKNYNGYKVVEAWINASPVVGIETPPLALVTGLSNRPNPFSSTTSIEFQLLRDAPARLAIYDIKGRLVEVLMDAHLEAGPYAVTWSTRRPSGIYFYQLTVAGVSETKKLLILR